MSERPILLHVENLPLEVIALIIGEAEERRCSPGEAIQHLLGEVFEARKQAPLANFLTSGEWASRPFAKPEAVGVGGSHSDSELLLKVKSWFAGRLQESAPVACYEYSISTVYKGVMGVGTVAGALSFHKKVKKFKGHEFEVRTLGKAVGEFFRIGFRSTARASFITFTRVEPSGKEGQ